MALFRRDPDKPRIPRKDRRGMSPVLVGALLIAVVLVLSYFGFTKHVPFTHGFRVNAVFENSNQIKKNSFVRIAGVNVGKVTGIKRYKDTNATVVEMEIQDKGLPIHKDATLKVRPRIFLEGNFFVDLQPGTPASPVIDDGDTLPMTQTAAPVQLGDLLTSLQQDTRRSLQEVLRDYGNALTDKPTEADDANADPDARGQTAAQSLNDNFDYAGPAFKNASIVNDAFLGSEPDDLSTIIASLATVTGALDRNESQLQDFVTNFNATMKIFADESSNLQASIRELSPTLRITNRTLADLNASFPPTRAFAREILPGVKETPATVDATFPWIRQVRPLVGPDELQGVVRELSPATQDLAKTINGTVELLPQADLASKCIARVILPTGDIVIQDGPATTGKANYKEFWYALVGLAGEGQNFDGNGMYVRFQPGGGLQTVSTGKGSLSGEALFGRNDLAPIGNRPAYPGQRPPYRPDVPCYTQKLPDLNGAATGKPDSSTESPPPTLGNAQGTINQVTGPVANVLNSFVQQVLDAVGTIPNPLTTVGAITQGATGAASGVLPTRSAKVPSVKGPAASDVAGQLLDRLNPFRKGVAKAKAKAKRKARAGG
jgi:phospholipid/cholesterol/gamma-HCH transport system substrate-binding protein